MPDYLEVIAVEPALDDLEGLSDHTYDSLQHLLEESAGKFDATVRVLFSSPWEDASLGVFTVQAGAVKADFSALSGDADALRAIKGAVSPKLLLSGDPDRFADALANATGGDDVGGHLPHRWESVEAILSLGQVLAGAIEGSPLHGVVTAEGKLGLLTVSRRGVKIEPIYFWFEDAQSRAMVQRHFPTMAAVSRPVVAGEAVAVMADALQERADPLGVLLVPRQAGSTALTKGPAQKRIEASWTATPEQLAAAVDDSANQGQRYDQVRAAFYQELPAEPATLATLLRRLPLETEEGRGAIYRLLSQLDAEGAHQALAQAFEHDAANEEFLATLVWRQRGVVDRLIARLVESWAPDRALADRIVRTLKDEYIEVRASQLAGAPAELKRRLGSLIAP